MNSDPLQVRYEAGMGQLFTTPGEEQGKAF
eukprot:SAG11_NODE_13600_length_647_cov_2.644161_1_plen_29_part_01